MIRSFRHKGLKKLFLDDETQGLRAEHIKRIRQILTALQSAKRVEDMALPGLRFHPLKGEYKGFHSVTVSGNYRIIFRFEDEDAYDVDYLDYH